MHDYQNRGLAGGAVRKSNKIKGEFCEEARIAVRKRLKTKGGVFAVCDERTALVVHVLAEAGFQIGN